MIGGTIRDIHLHHRLNHLAGDLIRSNALPLRNLRAQLVHPLRALLVLPLKGTFAQLVPPLEGDYWSISAPFK